MSNHNKILRIYGGDGINTDGADDELDYGAYGGPEAELAEKHRGFGWKNGEVRPETSRFCREKPGILGR